VWRHSETFLFSKEQQVSASSRCQELLIDPSLDHLFETICERIYASQQGLQKGPVSSYEVIWHKLLYTCHGLPDNYIALGVDNESLLVIRYTDPVVYSSWHRRCNCNTENTGQALNKPYHFAKNDRLAYSQVIDITGHRAPDNVSNGIKSNTVARSYG